MEQMNNRKYKKRVIIGVFLAILLAIALGIYVYSAFFFSKIISKDPVGSNTPTQTQNRNNQEDKENVLIVGIADGMTDTIMLSNYNPQDGSLSMMSIPRDTYYPRKNYNHPAQKKINAIYGAEGINGLIRGVEDLTGMHIDYYVKVDYKAVAAITDSIGGIEYTVPFDMNYDDPAADLHIHFNKGTVVASGNDIVKVMRWRKNNHGKGSYADGDGGRINTQQEILNLGFKKILSGDIAINIIRLQKPIMDYVKTNMPADQIVYHLGKLKSIKSDHIEFLTMPGEAKDLEGLYFIVPDKEKLMEMLQHLK